MEQRFDRGHERLALRFNGDRPASAEERHRIGFVGQAERIGGEIVAAQPEKLKRIFGIFDRLRDEGLGSFADQAGVGAADEKKKNIGWRSFEETFRFGTFDCDHVPFRSALPE